MEAERITDTGGCIAHPAAAPAQARALNDLIGAALESGAPAPNIHVNVSRGRIFRRSAAAKTCFPEEILSGFRSL